MSIVFSHVIKSLIILFSIVWSLSPLLLLLWIHPTFSNHRTLCPFIPQLKNKLIQFSFCCSYSLGCVAFTGALSLFQLLSIVNSSLVRGKSSYLPHFSMLPFCLGWSFMGLVYDVIDIVSSYVQQFTDWSSQIWSKSNRNNFPWTALCI